MDGGDVGEVTCVVVSLSGGEHDEDVGDIRRALRLGLGDAAVADLWITSTMIRECNVRRIPAVDRFPTTTGISFGFASGSQAPTEPQAMVVWLRACRRRC